MRLARMCGALGAQLGVGRACPRRCRGRRACRGSTGGAGGGGAVRIWGEFVADSCEADLEAFGLAVPSFAFGFGDAGEKVVADFLESGVLAGVGAQARAADAGLTELILIG